MLDCVTNPPTEPGRYCVSIHKIMTCDAIFWNFDGKNWDFDGWDHVFGELKPGIAAWWP